MQDVILFLVGIIVGAMNAIAGGGMLLGFPVLLATGMSPLVANITSNIVIMPGNLSSAFAYRKFLRKVPVQYLLLIIPAIIGGTIGALTLRNTSSTHFEDLVPGLILFAVVLFTFQPFLHNYVHRHIHGPKRHRQSLQPLLLTSLALLPLSIYGGYFGAGFGFILLAFLGFTKMHDIHQMNALKNIMALCIAVASLACLVTTGLVDWHHGLVMAAGNALGGYYGAIGAQKVSSHAIRVIVILTGIATVAYLGLRNY